MGHHQFKVITLELPGSDTYSPATFQSAHQAHSSPVVWRCKQRPIRDLPLSIYPCDRRLGRGRAIGLKAGLHHRQQSDRSLIAPNILAIRGTHEAWQAASNSLILLCIRLYFDWQSSSFARQTVPYIYGRLPSSLATHEGRRRQYQYLTSVLAECRAMATNRDAFRAP